MSEWRNLEVWDHEIAEVETGFCVADRVSDDYRDLFAAAPELYEALEWLEEYAKVQIKKYPENLDTDGWNKVVSALSKARGEKNE